MSGKTVANAMNQMYQRILSGVTETLNQSVTSRKLFKDDQWHGSEIEGTLHTRRSGAIGFGDDGAAFPTPRNQGHEKMHVGIKCMLASIKLTDGAMAKAAKSPEVAIDAVTDETEGIMKDIGCLDSFLSYRDGTGAVATVQAGTNDGVAGAALVDDARVLWEECKYDVYSSAGVYRGQVEIASVNPVPDASNNMEVFFKAALAGFVATDILYWPGAKDKVYSGLDVLIDDSITGTFQDVSMATQKKWTSLVLDAAGVKRDIDPVILRNFIAGLAQKSDQTPGEMREILLIGSPFITNQVDVMYESAYRLAPDTKIAGIACPAFQCSAGKVGIKGERMAPYYKLFAADPSDCYRGYHKKLAWRIEDGTLLKRSDDRATWTGTLIEFAENYVRERRTSGKICDLNETIVVSD